MAGVFAGLHEHDRAFVRHVADDEWHEFHVTGLVNRAAIVVLSGDEDHYVLEAQDVEELFANRTGIVPRGVREHGGRVIQVGMRYSTKQWRKVVAESREIAVAFAREKGVELAPGADFPAAPLLGGEPGKAREAAADPEGLWLVAEDIGPFSRGQEVQKQVPAARLGAFGLVEMDGTVVKVEFVSLDDLPSVADYRRRAGARPPPLELAAPAERAGDVTPRPAADGRGDIRTLAVDFDAHGERYKDWRAVPVEAYHEMPDPYPLDGPPSALYLVKHMERHGRTPKGWVEMFVRDRGLSSGDRVVHELRCLAEILELAGTFDQLNVCSLASLEFLCRRIQAVVEAHSQNAQKPDYSSVTLFSGVSKPLDAVAPELKAFVARRAKEEADIEKVRQKVRELKPGPKGGGHPPAAGK